MGNWPVATGLIEEFKLDGTSFWYLDSAYIQQTKFRSLRIERNRFWPNLRLGEHTMDRAYAMGIRMTAMAPRRDVMF